MAAYRVAYTSYDQQEAKKEAEAILTRLQAWETWSSYFFEILIFCNIQSILADYKHVNGNRLPPAFIFGTYQLKMLN